VISIGENSTTDVSKSISHHKAILKI